MYRVCLVAKIVGVLEGKNFPNREEADTYCLEIAERYGIKCGYLENLETKEREKIEEM